MAETQQIPPLTTATQAMNGLTIKDEKTLSIKAPSAPIEALHLPVSAADGIITKPFAGPTASSVPLPRKPLSIEHQGKYDALLKDVLTWKEVPTKFAKGAGNEALNEDERMWLTKECLLRYLRATKWNLAQAAARLRATLVWRREYGVYQHTADYISIENETGKQLVLGYDIHGRPCDYMNPSKQNTERTERQLQHMVFMLNRCIDLMPSGQETLTLLINFADTKSGQTTPLWQGKQALDILQNHFPERLGRALVTNVPFYVSAFLKLITPFIDPTTREKIKFNEDSGIHVPKEQLWKRNGGDVDFQYDHSVYWPALNQLADIKRAEYKARWTKGGSHIGESEDYLYGGTETGLFPPVSLRETEPMTNEKIEAQAPIASSGAVTAA